MLAQRRTRLVFFGLFQGSVDVELLPAHPSPVRQPEQAARKGAGKTLQNALSSMFRTISPCSFRTCARLPNLPSSSTRRPSCGAPAARLPDRAAVWLSGHRLAAAELVRGPEETGEHQLAAPSPREAPCPSASRPRPTGQGPPGTTAAPASRRARGVEEPQWCVLTFLYCHIPRSAAVTLTNVFSLICAWTLSDMPRAGARSKEKKDAR